MTFPDCTEIEVRLDGEVLHLTLDRPSARNAMNLKMVAEIASVFAAVHGDLSVRAIVLRGSNGNFCAGGDIKDMVAATSATGPHADNAVYDLNRAFGNLIAQVDAAPQVVIACLEGAVLGGGFGLACVSDIAIADVSAGFGMPETTLGLPPAQIAPFVVARIGLTETRRLALTGARFDGREAARLGVVHLATDGPQEMQAVLADQIARVLQCAPRANRVTKELIQMVATAGRDALLDHAAHRFAEAVVGDEGREGTRAFKDKRAPVWAEKQEG